VTAANVQYTRELRDRFGYSATWVPTSEIRIGDVGMLRHHEFERLATLADFGVSFDVRESRAEASIDYASEGAVSVAVKAAGQAPPVGLGLTLAEAGVIVSFGVKNAIVLQATGCVVASIENVHGLAKRMLDLYEGQRWPEDYVAVTEVVRAQGATVLISSASGGSVALTARGGVTLGPTSLGDVNAGLQVALSRDIDTQIVARGGLCPLFRARGIRKRWLRTPEVVRRGGTPVSVAQSDSDAFVDEVDYEDFG
jgi:hypothetical protein